jgi:hypothetical protein
MFVVLIGAWRFLALSAAKEVLCWSERGSAAQGVEGRRVEVLLGEAELSWSSTRRTLIRTMAPILSSFRRIVSVPISPRRVTIAGSGLSPPSGKRGSPEIPGIAIGTLFAHGRRWLESGSLRSNRGNRAWQCGRIWNRECGFGRWDRRGCRSGSGTSDDPFTR